MKKYRILLSAIGFDEGKSGISNYIINVLKVLSKEHQITIVCLKDDVYFFNEFKNVNIIELPAYLNKASVNSLYHLLVLPFKIKYADYDFIFLPAGNRRLFCKYPIPTVITFHDLSQYHMKGKYDILRTIYIRNIIPFFLKKAQVFLAVSESTKLDMIRFYKLDEKQITVNYNGCCVDNFSPVESEDDKAVLEKHGIRKKYFFYTSRIEHPGKNHISLVKAYERMGDKIHNEYDLVFAGSNWNGSETVINYINESKIKQNVKLLGFVPDEDLPVLYRKSAVFVFPSLYEGFGIPLIEAMASGVPICCSDKSSLPEIGGNAVLKFEPGKVDSIKNAIESLLQDDDLSSKLVNKGFKRAKLFTWENHASKVIEEYEKYCSQNEANDIELTSKALNKKNIKRSIFELLFKFFIFAFNLLCLLILTAPTLVCLLFRKIFKNKDIFITRKFYAEKGKVICLKCFRTENPLISKFTLFYYCLINKIKFIGGNLYDTDHQYDDPSFNSTELINKPGIISLWFIRSASKIAHEGIINIEKEYRKKRNARYDLSLLIKSIPAFLFSCSNPSDSSEIELLDIKFNNIKMSDAIELISDKIKNKIKTKIFFVNPDCFNKLYTDNTYKNSLQKSHYIFPDGSGVNIACKIIGTPLKENVNGTDMFPYLMENIGKNGYKLFLFGAKPGIVDILAEKIHEDYPDVKIVGTQHGYYKNENLTDLDIVTKINTAKADLLLVAFGAPIQENWITEYFSKLDTVVLMGVGGLFDFYSGKNKRAPKWMREVGIEWIYRIIQEPRRMWKRYIIGNPVFIYRVLKWKRKKQLTKQQNTTEI